MNQRQLLQSMNEIKRRLCDIKARSVESIRAGDRAGAASYDAERVELMGLLYRYSEEYWDLISMATEGQAAVAEAERIIKAGEK